MQVNKGSVLPNMAQIANPPFCPNKLQDFKEPPRQSWDLRLLRLHSCCFCASRLRHPSSSPLLPAWLILAELPFTKDKSLAIWSGTNDSVWRPANAQHNPWFVLNTFIFYSRQQENHDSRRLDNGEVGHALGSSSTLWPSWLKWPPESFNQPLKTKKDNTIASTIAAFSYYSHPYSC